jgi:hypothetical protein
MTIASETVIQLLSEPSIEVIPGTFALMGFTHQDWTRLLQKPELSPRPDSIFMVFRDNHEVTLLVDEDDCHRLREVVPEGRVEAGFRLVTLDLELDWDVVGYLALVTELLASEGIPVGVLSSVARDHLMIKQEDLGRALLALGKQTEDLC